MKRTITLEWDDSGGLRASSVGEELIEVIKANRYLRNVIDGLRYTEDGETVRTVPGTFNGQS